jgi:transposase
LRYTLLSAINTKGVVCYQIFDKSVNGEIYKQFIDNNKNLFINKIIYHDNVRFHHSKILKKYCTKKSITLKYTPAYTPEFNPIELFFSTVKKYYKKLNHVNLINDIDESLKYTIKINNIYVSKNYLINFNFFYLKKHIIFIKMTVIIPK